MNILRWIQRFFIFWYAYMPTSVHWRPKNNNLVSVSIPSTEIKLLMCYFQWKEIRVFWKKQLLLGLMQRMYKQAWNILSYQIAGKPSKTTNVMSKELSRQLEEAVISQHWDYFDFSNNNCSGLESICLNLFYNYILKINQSFFEDDEEIWWLKRMLKGRSQDGCVS